MQTLPQLRAHVGAALNIGASPLQLREAIYQCAPYIGFPKTLNAIDIANKVFEKRGISLPLESAGTVDGIDPSAREQAGAAIQTPLYGNEVKEVFSSLPEPFDEFVPHLLTSSAFGDFATRGGLDVAQRELISLVAIAAGSTGAAMYTFKQPGVYVYLNHNLIEAVDLGALAQIKVDGKWDNGLMEQLKAPTEFKEEKK